MSHRRIGARITGSCGVATALLNVCGLTLLRLTLYRRTLSVLAMLGCRRGYVRQLVVRLNFRLGCLLP